MSTTTRYELLDRIAIGGMAELFRARILGEQGFYKVVAVKRILPQYATDELFVQMLVDEARTASYLSHPNIAEVFELRRDADGGLFIALEYVAGPSLAALLAKLNAAGRRMPEACALDVAIHLLEALDHAHKMTDPSGRPLGVVHRDVSPDNVLITRDGAVKLTDFGVAKARGRMTKTQQGTIKGKLAYMSPEQVRGLAIDGRADLFAAGLVLWEALTGRAHYDATADFELMRMVADGRIRPLSEAGIPVPDEVQAALDKAMAYDAEDRFARAGDFARELTTYHRRTFPEYSPSQLGALVDEFFKERFDLLAERLRHFEAGSEKPAAVISLSGPIDGMRLAATADEVAATNYRQASVAAELPAAKTAPGSAPAAPQMDVTEPVPARRPAPVAGARRVSKTDQPKPRKASKQDVPKSAAAEARLRAPAPPPEVAAKASPPTDDSADQREAIAQALARSKAEEKAAKKGTGGLTILLSVLLFAVAIGAGLGGMAWFRGFDPDAAAAPPVLEAKPLERPDEPAAPPGPTDPGRDPAKGPAKIDRPKVPGPRVAAPKDPKKPEAPPEPAVDGPKGTLEIECEPAGEVCEVEIDGRRAGLAPLEREVLAGKHTVRVRIKSINAASKPLPVEVRAGEVARHRINAVR